MRLYAILAVTAALAACSGQSDADRVADLANEMDAQKQAELRAPAPQSVTTDSGLRFETLQPGQGRRPQMGEVVMVTYDGRLTDGTQFDASQQPVPMVVGQLIPGFNEGLMMMNEGGRYRLTIPPAIGYGAEGAGSGTIPPNATLVFTVQLVSVGGATGAQPLPPGG